MITRLQIDQFKCFLHQEIDLSNLTVLTGSNRSGKSTVIQSLLLLRQAYFKQEFNTNSISLNGALVNIGSVRDARNSNSKDDSICFKIEGDAGEVEFISHFFFNSNLIDGDELYLKEKPTINNTSCVFGDIFSYLNAERIGPKSIYPIKRSNFDTTLVGIHGEYAVDQLSKNSEEPLYVSQLAYPKRESTDSLQIGYNAREWMRAFFPTIDWRIKRFPEADAVTITYQNIGDSEYVRPINTGFGVSYALPIVCAGMISQKNSLLIVENPESHLHPAAQSSMGVFLAHLAAGGIQVIVETHSDHILNGIRLAVKRQALPNEKAIIQFFNRDEQGGPSTMKSLSIGVDGKVSNWPSGFFDQAEKDLLQLF